MNSPVRPSSYFTSGIAPSAPGGILATVPNPPPEIARLPAGTTLRGVVVGEDSRGQTLVKTDLGTLAVATKAHLPKDSEVVLQLRSSGAHLHIMIMQARSQAQAQAQAPLPPSLPNATLPGQPPGPSLEAPGAQGGTYGAGQASAPPTGPLTHAGPFTDLVTLGQTVRATVQTPAGALPAAQGGPAAAGLGAEEVPPALARLAPGTVLALRILSVSGPQLGPGTIPPGPAAGPAANPQASPQASPQANPFGAAAPGAAQAPGGALGGAQAGPAQGGPALLTPPGTAPGGPPGAPVGVSLGTPLAAAPAASGSAPGAVPGALPGAPAAPPAAVPGAPPEPVTTTKAPGPGPALQAGALTFGGQVLSVSHAGQPILTTPLGTLILELEARLPAGTNLTLELAPGGLPREAGAEARPSTPGSLGYAWPALEEALSLLSDPAATAGAAREALPGLPQPGPRLASGILFFLAALRGGDLGGWLGAGPLQTLRARGGETLVGRLARDLAQMGRMADGAGAGSIGSDWRLLPIPLWDGERLHQWRLYLRQHDQRRDEARNRARRGATRFILELEMSRLGEMQLDGLVRDKRFDLMLRTRAALPEAMRRDIREIFDDANAAAGYAGTLGFQASADWHILPAETSYEASGLVV